MQGGRGEVPALLVALATAWLMGQGVVGAATSGNTLRASHLILDQYSPLPPYHHGPELHGRRSNDGNSQPEDEHQVNRKVEDDSVAYRSAYDRQRRRDSSIASISTNDFSIVGRSSEASVVRSNPGEPLPRMVPSESTVWDDWRSKNFAGSKEFGKEGVVDYAAAPPSETDEPFVADETFQDEGPGSVEIYKLDLFEEKKAPANGAPSVKVPPMVGTSPVVPVTSRTTNHNNSNKSKTPKKSSRHSWKFGKATSGVIKLTTSDAAAAAATTTTRMMVTTGKDDGKDGKNILHGRSSFSESELRSEAPPNGDAFGVGGVPELQVGCEGLEASSSSYFSPSRKLRRSVLETKNGKGHEDPATVEHGIVPISLNLDYDWSDESDEEMDELLKLKKLERETSKSKENRGDMDPTLHDFFNGKNDAKEKLPIRGDLGKASVREESIRRPNDSRRGRRSVDGFPRSDSSGYSSGSRKLLWSQDSEEDSDLWGFDENEGILSSDGLDSDETKRHRERERRVDGRGRNEYGRNVANAEIDKIREEYERLLEQQKREEEERLRRLKELEARRASTANDRRDEEERRRSYEERMRMEELRKREEEARRANPDDSRRNLTPEDRRSYEERRREWMMKRRQQEEEREQRRRMEEERRRQEEARNAPSNLMRSGYPYNRRNESRTREEERMRQEGGRERVDRQRYDSERRRMEEERRRYEAEQERSRNEVTREEEYRRRMKEEERRRMMERQREEERRKMLQQHPSRNPNATRDRSDEEYRRRLEEHRRRAEEDQRRQEEERRLQEYVRRNQPIDVRDGDRRGEWDASRRRQEEEEQQRRAIEAVRQLNRSRYPGSPSERRQHGPSAPTYIDPRVSLDESRRRQEMEASLQRRRQEEEEQRRRQEEEYRRRQEERKREEEYRRQQSRRYEEERKRMEARRREEEERKRRYMIEKQRAAAAASSSAGARRDPWPGTRQDSQDRAGQRDRQNTASLVPGNLRLEGRGRETERERIRKEEERRRQQALARDNERRGHEARLKAQREREAYIRAMEEQRKRQEEARLNALPVSARIIVRAEGSPTHSRPSVTTRNGFANEIDFPRLNPHNNGPKVSGFPSPPAKQSVIPSPGPCVWAVVQCCPANTNRLVTCFESLGCPGVNWDPNPCRGSIADAARDEVRRFYAASEEENRY